jgi:hypothetical protein
MQQESNYGYVYCMTNDYTENLCKIGYVRTNGKTSQQRAKELSSSTSSPGVFMVAFDIKVKNASKYEIILHNKLCNIRLKSNKEFFVCKPEDIISYFKMENLIVNDDEKNNFHKNYLTIYDNKLQNMVNINDYINDKFNEEDLKQKLKEQELKEQKLKKAEAIKTPLIKKNKNYCEKCEKKFESRSGKWKHDNSIHKNNYPTAVKCLSCNKDFYRKDSLNRHKCNVNIVISKLIYEIKDLKKIVSDKNNNITNNNTINFNNTINSDDSNSDIEW